MNKIMLQRMCVSCRKRFLKQELLRVCSSEGEIKVDKSGRMDGRGAYVCSKECLDSSRKGRRLERALKCAVSEEIYKKIGEVFDER